MNLKTYKQEIRRKVLAERDKLSLQEINLKSEEIKKNLWTVAEFVNSEKIFLFVNFRSEVRTIPIIEKCLEEHKKVILPLTDVQNRRLVLYFINDLSHLKEGSYGILEPDPEKNVMARPQDIDCAIIPGSAFDLKGGRMGYGGGFYDRIIPLLKQETFRIALAYELQIIDKVPMGYFDQRVDIIVTEKRVIRIKNDR
jgi:5-formyltetrahydrofolate cyclo-ligase